MALRNQKGNLTPNKSLLMIVHSCSGKYPESQAHPLSLNGDINNIFITLSI